MSVFHSLRSVGSALVVAAAVITTACGSDSSTAPIQPASRLELTVSTENVYEGDVITLGAVVRDAIGNVVPGAQVSWALSDTTRGELAGNGILTVFGAGNVTVIARSGALSSTRTIVVRRMAVQTVSVGTGALQLQGSDVATVGIHVQGSGGRTLLGREVKLSSDNPAVAMFDPSGRVRAVSAGSTTLRATVEGVVGLLRVDVAASGATLNLSRIGETRLPLLISADSVMWDGVREYHEVYLEQGQLLLKGGAQPRYEIDVRYTEYNVQTIDGRRSMQIRTQSREYDRGLLNYDARGDLLMTSEYIYPLSHTASPESGGVRVRFRVPGTNDVLELFYRREPA